MVSDVFAVFSSDGESVMVVECVTVLTCFSYRHACVCLSVVYDCDVSSGVVIYKHLEYCECGCDGYGCDDECRCYLFCD